jgi:hypothetical protein
MADPITVGVLVAGALRLAAEAVVKGAVGETVKDAYRALKTKLSSWAAGDVDALEKQPASKAREAVIVETVDHLPPPDQKSLRDLAQALTNELEKQDPGAVGYDIGRLKALQAEFGNVTVIEGVGVRIKDAEVDTFRAGDVSVGAKAPGK